MLTQGEIKQPFSSHLIAEGHLELLKQREEGEVILERPHPCPCRKALCSLTVLLVPAPMAALKKWEIPLLTP